jgi:hypothetical protein
VPATVWLAGKLETVTDEIEMAGMVVTATETALARSSALDNPPETAAVTLIAGMVTTFTLTTLATVTVDESAAEITGALNVTTAGVSVMLR